MNECRYFDKCYDRIDGVGLVRCDGKGLTSTVSNHPIGKCSDYEPMVDRGKLLALATELDAEGCEGWAHAVNVGSIACRIREALGADDG